MTPEYMKSHYKKKLEESYRDVAPCPHTSQWHQAYSSVGGVKQDTQTDLRKSARRVGSGVQSAASAIAQPTTRQVSVKRAFALFRRLATSGSHRVEYWRAEYV